MSKLAEIKKLLFGVAENVQKLAGEPKQLGATEVMISERVVGGKVELIGTDGTPTALEDGDYILDDGFKFTIKDGLISAIAEEQILDTDTAKTDEPGADEMAAKVADLESRIASIESKIGDTFSAVESVKTLLNSNIEAEKETQATAKETFEQVKLLMSKFEETPADTSKTAKKDEYAMQEKAQREGLFATFQKVVNADKN